MKIRNTIEPIINAVRGQNPAYVAVSPDVYQRWQEEEAGREPCTAAGIPICIRDCYKPGTMLILAPKYIHDQDHSANRRTTKSFRS